MLFKNLDSNGHLDDCDLEALALVSQDIEVLRDLKDTQIVLAVIFNKKKIASYDSIVKLRQVIFAYLQEEALLRNSVLRQRVLNAYATTEDLVQQGKFSLLSSCRELSEFISSEIKELEMINDYLPTIPARFRRLRLEGS